MGYQKLSKINENKALGLELFIDYKSFAVFMAKDGEKVMEWKKISLNEINGLIETYFDGGNRS